MKLRIHDNSIRLRLTRSEVASFAEIGSVQGRTPLFPQVFAYQLTATEGSQAPAITFKDATLRISLPLESVRQWAGTDQVGIEANIAIPGSPEQSIQLTIEKDFRCLHGPSSTVAADDFFTNPLAEIEKAGSPSSLRIK